MRFERLPGIHAQRVLRIAAACAAVTALMIVNCQFAQAHAYPTHQAPAAGATVTTSQKDVVIDFDDGLEPAFSSITVRDAHMNAVTRGKAVVDASNRKRMSVALDPLTPGVYTVSWTAVAADGHRTQGHYTFTAK
ncbi:copper resistance protein CopC [Burkholderia sp. H160]|nr:copper resistance protein CopC [Burkholderia sp. H160]